ncbi:MAG TPA: anhydro-N-acetylmuramic acid kinase [Candidatus Eisenbacteria bacterium]
MNRGFVHAVGVMTGTSADGADAAAVRIERGAAPRRATLLALRSRSFPDEMREAILGAQEGTLPMRRLLALSVELARVAADVAREAALAAKWDAPPDVVGYHGQTVFHDPRGERSGIPLTAQIGEPTVVARALGAPVVSNFRMADLLEGGEGAPLVPRFDWHQFASREKDRVLLNLGGIANLTRIPRGAGLDRVVAFDCGPGNMLLDALAAALLPDGARYDRDGTRAAAGRADVETVRALLGDPFFARKPPKSAGREEFGAAYRDAFLERTATLSVDDRLRTAVALTAGAVARAVALSGPGLPDEVVVSGGGTRNATLLAAIQGALGGVPVATSDTLGVPSEAKEAMAFAFLAAETLAKRPGNVPSATGAGKEVVLGSVTPAPAPRR